PTDLESGGRWDRGGFLSTLLVNTDHRLGVDAAARALMEVHGVTPGERLMASKAEAIAALRRADLGVAEFEEEELARLLAINYPALLELRTASDETRIVALLDRDGEMIELGGVGERDSLRVAISALEDHFTGMAWVVWRPYLDIPDLIGDGERGAGVLWLQEALFRLGYTGVRITGTYDDATSMGVEEFQEKHGIRVDGLAGPFTQMLIYGELQEFAPLRLEKGESG
ncbi:MAG: peptidoglycan-binding domain-containing protein, partial [Myxococcota bacterium]